MDASPASGGAGLLDGLFDRRPDVVRAEVQEDQPRVELRELQEVLGQPVEALQLDAARLEELGPGSGVLAGLLLEELVEGPQGRDRGPQLVRDVGQEVAAAVAVAADDVDALLDAVGHGVELEGKLGELERAGRRGVRRDAPGEIAFGQPSAGFGEAAEGRREAPGEGC